jgi:hypothetical protein
MSNLILGNFALENFYYSTLPATLYPEHLRPICPSQESRKAKRFAHIRKEHITTLNNGNQGRC